MAAYSAAQVQKPPKIATVYRTLTPITPADATAIGPFEGFYVGGAGNIVVVPTGQTSPVTMAVLAGSYHPIEIQGVNATSTTATGIMGLG